MSEANHSVKADIGGFMTFIPDRTLMGGRAGVDYCLRIGETSCLEMGGGLSLSTTERERIHSAGGSVSIESSEFFLNPYVTSGLSFLPKGHGLGARFSLMAGPVIMNHDHLQVDTDASGNTHYADETITRTGVMGVGEAGLVLKLNTMSVQLSGGIMALSGREQGLDWGPAFSASLAASF